ncbi:hypothetical protein Tco_0638891, partial [Tanacetum coccineum]
KSKEKPINPGKQIFLEKLNGLKRQAKEQKDAADAFRSAASNSKDIATSSTKSLCTADTNVHTDNLPVNTDDVLEGDVGP